MMLKFERNKKLEREQLINTSTTNMWGYICTRNEIERGVWTGDEEIIEEKKYVILKILELKVELNSILWDL
jgi:hypothetical protein